jgi:hypothetical protein
VHRFTRITLAADGATVTVPDVGYADLTLRMRAGDNPGAVFDRWSRTGDAARRSRMNRAIG